jgi:hypothetical protein
LRSLSVVGLRLRSLSVVVAVPAKEHGIPVKECGWIPVVGKSIGGEADKPNAIDGAAARIVPGVRVSLPTVWLEAVVRGDPRRRMATAKRAPGTRAATHGCADRPRWHARMCNPCMAAARSVLCQGRKCKQCDPRRGNSGCGHSGPYPSHRVAVSVTHGTPLFTIDARLSSGMHVRLLDLRERGL